MRTYSNTDHIALPGHIPDTFQACFILQTVLPVIPLEGVDEKQRYAKIESYSDEIRISEGAIYARLVLNFTEDLPKPPNEYELMSEVDFITETKSNG